MNGYVLMAYQFSCRQILSAFLEIDYVVIGLGLVLLVVYSFLTCLSMLGAY